MSRLECEGWWEQESYGVQPMNDLLLEFSVGVIRGSGTDIIGSFTLVGTVDRGKVTMTKHYLGQHRVSYQGQFDGEGTMHGTWHIALDQGRWAIRVLRRQSASTGRIAEEISPPVVVSKP